MRKPPPPSAQMRRYVFSGAPQSTGPKAPANIVLAGPAPLSRNLLILDPDFGGCRWPLDGEGGAQRFCCAPAKGRFCAVHRRNGVVPIPASGRGSAAEFIRSLERFL